MESSASSKAVATNSKKSNAGCVHLEELKTLGAMRNYEKVLTNFCVQNPAYLANFKRGGLRNMKMRRCFSTRCMSRTTATYNPIHQLYGCLSCVNIFCKSHINEHTATSRANGPHNIWFSVNDGTTFCSSCSDFIYDEAFERMRELVLLKDLCSPRQGSGSNFTQLMATVRPTVSVISPLSTFGLRGLINLKNTCYVNSIIQVLVHTPMLVDFFLSEASELECEAMHDRKPCMLLTMTAIFRDFYNGEKEPLALTQLMTYMWRNANHLASSDQQDAHEFLTALLEAMGRHFLYTKTGCAIEGIFHGTLKSTVRCLECHSESVTKEPFMEISLEVFGNSEITLEDCLLRYCQVEQLDPTHTIHCDNCKMKRRSSKQLELMKIPLILCIHFKRFQNLNRNKWEHHIKFDTHEDLQIYASTEIEDAYEEEVADNIKPKRPKFEMWVNHPENFAYSLYAVVSHKGSSEGGHYITYFRNSQDAWFLCNDQEITKVSWDEVRLCQAYMLFYHRTNLPQQPDFFSNSQ